MKAQIHHLILLFLAGLGLPALAHAAGDGDIIIGREVPSRSAIRHGDPSPDVSVAHASQADVIVDTTQQVVVMSGQSDDMLLGTMRGSVIGPAGQLQGLPVATLTAVPLVGAGTIGAASGSGGGIAGAGISQQLQSGLQPLSGLAH
ncbi:hypothetical protein [Aquitalea denitrificans]|uniref:hypothetical protein n=1 Tax=Aquitalea denitrificans TaxID=519081 RepID=UPI00135C9443|nr:hypothetical protein [Aquitalea denitrificans]